MKTTDSGATKILIAEDEAAIGNICRRALTSKGIDVDIAANGKAAQTMIKEKQYDVCLIDIKMPVMNGKELYQWLEEKHPQLASRVIFTTGDIMSGDTRDFLKRADRLFLPKPFTPDELKEIVRKALKEAGK